MDHPNPRSFVVLGTGSWGSALALHLDRQGHQVVLWGHDSQEVATIKRDKANEYYLPGVAFPDSIQLTDDLVEAFSASDDPIVLIVVPSHVFADMIDRISPFLTDKMRILWGTKGVTSSAEFFHDVCQKRLGNLPVAVLSGPSFAKEVAKGLPTAVTIAASDTVYGKELVDAFHHHHFRVYLSADLIGVELGGTVKNVLAIAVGMSDGIGFGANSRAALITRGLAELTRLGEKVGAHFSTLMGLSGVGDIVLTCTDNQSRNRRFGLALGQGASIEQAEADIGQVVEGKYNVKQIMLLAKQYQVDMPICEQVHAVIFNGVSVRDAVNNLLTRIPKHEV